MRRSHGGLEFDDRARALALAELMAVGQIPTFAIRRASVRRPINPAAGLGDADTG